MCLCKLCHGRYFYSFHLIYAFQSTPHSYTNNNLPDGWFTPNSFGSYDVNVIVKSLSEEKNKNEELTEKLNTIENKFIESQNQLLEAKQRLTSLKNDIKPTKEKFDENQNEIINLNDQMIKEISCSNDIGQKNNVTNALIEEHTKKIDKLSEENDILKKEIN